MKPRDSTLTSGIADQRSYTMSPQALTDSTKFNMDSPLLRLPQELLIRVASYLTTPELGNLRVVCKEVESRLFESFAYEFFHKR